MSAAKNKHDLGPSPVVPVVMGTGLVALDIIIDIHGKLRRDRWAGGTCGNVLTILSYLGWRAYPVARLNGDRAGECVRRDLRRWRVHLDFAQTGSGPHTPIVVQRNYRDAEGAARHRYTWTCPNCGTWLPRYRAVIATEARQIAARMTAPQVFFLDRLSRGALILAEASAKHGAMVVFEPSGVGDESLFAEALGIAHIVKYSHDRLPPLEVANRDSGPLLEVQTLGAAGLQYRSRLSDCSTEWTFVPPFEVEAVRDSAGAGDWCTAGLIHKLGRLGSEGVGRATKRDIEAALAVGQAYAAVNCQFEGARGAMYGMTEERLTATAQQILTGENVSAGIGLGQDDYVSADDEAPICPACDRHQR